MEVAEAFEAVTDYFPKSPLAQNATELAELLREMATEERNLVDSSKRIAQIPHHVFHVRDARGVSVSIPGRCEITRPIAGIGESDHVRALREYGERAWPALVEMLKGERPIRAVAIRFLFPDDPVVLRYQDAAVQILQHSMSDEVFAPMTQPYLSRAPAEVQALVYQAAKAAMKKSKGTLKAPR